MTVADYLVGVLRLAAILVPAWLGARAWRRHLAPGWRGGLAVLADAVGLLAAVITIGELLGTFGDFRSAALIPAMALASLGSILWCRSRSTRRPVVEVADRASNPSGRRVGEIGMVAAAVALVTAQWATWVAKSVDSGIGNAAG